MRNVLSVDTLSGIRKPVMRMEMPRDACVVERRRKERLDLSECVFCANFVL